MCIVSVSAEIIVTTTQSSSNTISVSSSDLGQTAYASSSSASSDAVGTRHAELFNGIVGTVNSVTTEPGLVRMAPGDSVTVNLDISTNTEGYDITGIDTFFGWNPSTGGRSNQAYEIFWVLLTEPLPPLSPSATGNRILQSQNIGPKFPFEKQVEDFFSAIL